MMVLEDMLTLNILYWIQFSVCFLVLTVATYQDIKERLVYDWIWYIGGTIGIGLHILGFIFVPNYYWLSLIINLIVAIIFIGICMIPKIFGGTYLMGPADLIGIFIIALILPFHSPLVHYSRVNLYIAPSIFAVLTNTFLIFALFLCYLGVSNYFLYKKVLKNSKSSTTWFQEFSHLSRGKKLLLFLLGRRISVENLVDYRFVKLLEDYNEDDESWEAIFDLSYEDEYTHEEMKEIYMDFHKLGLQEIWISPMVPLITLFLLGVVVTSLGGNLLFQILELIFFR
ncbi:hypothetical protein WKT22_00851 [Candidatus Lokiarchaeum ossiferum]